MRLELRGDTKTLYDAIVALRAELGRGPTCGEACRAAGISTGRASALFGCLEDIGLIERRGHRLIVRDVSALTHMVESVGGL